MEQRILPHYKVKTIENSMKLCLRCVKTYEMIDEWIDFIKLVDERNALSDRIRSDIKSKAKSTAGLKDDVKELEAWIKRFKKEISRILKDEHKILFMVTTTKYPKEMRLKGYHSKKRGFIIDQREYYVPNYYMKDQRAEYQDGERYMIEDIFELNEMLE